MRSAGDVSFSLKAAIEQLCNKYFFLRLRASARTEFFSANVRRIISAIICEISGRIFFRADGRRKKSVKIYEIRKS
ncbi:MAG: hypothetical protein C0425_08775 [Chlorobiaceae bacterium]|nr:hypothetical protein [Chlorobiaceae bacterium]MBA4310415.1 hypothetical protein [Chlorobiaceae bacterium]